MRKKKILLLLLIGIMILPFVCLGSIFVYRKYQISKYSFPNYYKGLAIKCSFKGVFNSLFWYDCCISSVKTMADNNYKIKPKDGCPKGFHGTAAGCPSSYDFCVPGEWGFK